jgi:hypothetical protein
MSATTFYHSHDVGDTVYYIDRFKQEVSSGEVTKVNFELKENYERSVEYVVKSDNHITVQPEDKVFRSKETLAQKLFPGFTLKVHYDWTHVPSYDYDITCCSGGSSRIVWT